MSSRWGETAPLAIRRDQPHFAARVRVRAAARGEGLDDRLAPAYPAVRDRGSSVLDATLAHD